MSNPTDSTQRFGNRVEDYARYRPDYPMDLPALISDSRAVIAEVGSGTGILTRHLLEAGHTVHAIEPNGPMRAHAESELQGYGKFVSGDGTAEATGLDGESVDCIVAAQAFHWFDPDPTRLEWSRVLKPGGLAFLIWNSRQLDASPFDAAYEEFLLEWAIDYDVNRHQHVDVDRVEAFFAPEAPTFSSLRNLQSFDREGLIGRIRSCSYMPSEGHDRFASMCEAASALFEEFEREGRVTMTMNTEIWSGILPKRN